MKSYYEAISELNDSDRLAVYDAIAKYGIFGEMPNLSGIPKVVFTLIKPTIDSSNKKYNASVENGKKGGRPNKITKEKPSNNPAITQEKPSGNHEKEKDKEKEYEKDIEKDKDTLGVTKSRTNKISFSIPTISDIQQYASENCLPDCAEDFYLYYDSNGWMVGKNKMKSWKSAYSRWAKQNKNGVMNNGTGKAGNSQQIHFAGIKTI